MRILVQWGALLLLSCPAWATGGFTPSAEKNVVMLKGKTKGATAFILQVPGAEPVLVTQQRALAEVGPEIILQWGHAIGIFFRLRKVEERSYQFGYQPEVIWSDDRLGVAALKLPPGMLGYCECRGLTAGEYRPGPGRLVGYPVLERRIYPRTSAIYGLWRELWGDVRQRSSSGRLYAEGGKYWGDMDALPGDDGGPLLDDQDRVVGIVHELRAERREGYRYVSPALGFVPIAEVLKGLASGSGKK